MSIVIRATLCDWICFTAASSWVRPATGGEAAAEGRGRTLICRSMSVSEELGEPRTAEIPAGTLEYRAGGSGPPMVFAHGAGVNGDLWRKVAPALHDRYRCIVPD